MTLLIRAAVIMRHTRAGNSVGDKGAQALAEALKLNSTLKVLGLACEGRLVSACLCAPSVHIRRPVPPPACYLCITCPPLPLALHDISTRAGAEGDATDKGCRDNATHTRAVNRIGVKGAQALAEALNRFNSALKWLDLNCEGRLVSSCLCAPSLHIRCPVPPPACCLCITCPPLPLAL